MSKSIAVLGSHTSGHSGYPSTVVVEGTTKLTINGKPAATHQVLLNRLILLFYRL